MKAQQAAKAVFQLTTYKKDGSVLAQCNGFFVDNNGEAVAPWKPFVGAERAEVTDAKGKKTEVKTLIGANELYDICRFNTEEASTPVQLATAPVAAGDAVTVVGKNNVSMKVSNAEKFKQYNYYTLTVVNDKLYGCPVVNKQGKVIGLYASTTIATATDVAFTNDFKASGLSLNDPVLKASGIRPALPDKLKDAMLILFLSSEQNNPARHRAYVDEFISKFPTSAEGYSQKGTILANQQDFANASKIMEEGISKASAKDEAHFNYAKVIYQKVIHFPDSVYPAWNADKVIDESDKAYQIKPIALYKHLKGQAYFVKKDYDQAYSIFMELTKDTTFKSSEVYYEAAMCRQMQNAPKEEILTLLDNAVNSQPLSYNSAPYVLARAQLLDEMGQYRKALLDYNRYDTLTLGRSNDSFYYMRYACELKLKQYQQALNDIAHAIVLNRNVAGYYAEMAQLQMQVKMYDKGIQTADLGLKVFPDYGDLYLLKGLCYIFSGDKKQGLSILEEAKSHGAAEKADALIKKYN
jgi:tetratricopeptide (TPR) repeat protein